MPAVVQTGDATIWGVCGASPITISGYASFHLQGARPTHKFTLNELKDGGGFDAALIATNSYVEMDVEFYPAAATKSAANAIAVFLSPLATVTTAGFNVTALNGRWVYVGDESMDLSNASSAKIMLRVRKYDDATQNTRLTTQVSS